METINTECLSQESLERDLKDNRELKYMENKEIELRENCASLAKQLGNLDFNSVDKEKKVLMKEKETFSMQRGKLFGQLGRSTITLTNCDGKSMSQNTRSP